MSCWSSRRRMAGWSSWRRRRWIRWRRSRRRRRQQTAVRRRGPAPTLAQRGSRLGVSRSPGRRRRRRRRMTQEKIKRSYFSSSTPPMASTTSAAWPCSGPSITACRRWRGSRCHLTLQSCRPRHPLNGGRITFTFTCYFQYCAFVNC